MRAHIIADPVDVPVRLTPQPLYPLRARLTSTLGQCPPVPTFQTHQQPRYIFTHPSPRFRKREPPPTRNINESNSATTRSNTTHQIYQHQLA